MKNDPLLQTNFEMAIKNLHDIDDKVQASSPIDTSKGDLVLPWIDREAIDHKQGIKSEKLTVHPGPIDFGTIGWDNWVIRTKIVEKRKESYEKANYCIRVLAVISERLCLEKDLNAMVQLHLKLLSNRKVSYTTLDRDYRFDLAPLRISKKLEMSFGLRKRKKGQPLGPQENLDLQRYNIIANDFWGHQARRKSGDMEVGDIILPWVEVQNCVP